MAEDAEGLVKHPDMRRIEELLYWFDGTEKKPRPLLKSEAAELRHLADLHGVKLQWQVYDLTSFPASRWA